VHLPLFPLNAVLFPAGVLPLRVFEPRYVDMVGACMRDETTFGVCLISGGQAAGRDARPESIGCEARITACDVPQLGVLHLRVEGLRRFKVRTTQRQPSGLLLGGVEFIAPDRDDVLAPEHRACALLLTRIIEDLDAQAAEKRRQNQEEAAQGSADTTTSHPVFLKPYRLDSSVWVGNRLCEVLPVPMKAKQKLMELDDAHARLDIITQYLKQHAVID